MRVEDIQHEEFIKRICHHIPISLFGLCYVQQVLDFPDLSLSGARVSTPRHLEFSTKRLGGMVHIVSLASICDTEASSSFSCAFCHDAW